MKKDYLKCINEANIYDVVKLTSLDFQPLLSKRFNNKIYLKREDQQAVFSFKIRGAFYKMLQMTNEALKKGVIAASAGNHAQGVAMAAKKLNSPATIVMPTTTPEIKTNAVKQHGATVILEGKHLLNQFYLRGKLKKKKG